MKIQPKPLATITFAVLGIFWLVSGVAGEGSALLVIPGIASLVTAWMLRTGFQKRHARTMLVSSAVYNSILAVYHAYASTLLLQSGLLVFGAIALIAYSVATIVSAFILLVGYANVSVLVPAETSSEESKTQSSSPQQ